MTNRSVPGLRDPQNAPRRPTALRHVLAAAALATAAAAAAPVLAQTTQRFEPVKPGTPAPARPGVPAATAAPEPFPAAPPAAFGSQGFQEDPRVAATGDRMLPPNLRDLRDTVPANALQVARQAGLRPRRVQPVDLRTRNTAPSPQEFGELLSPRR